MPNQEYRHEYKFLINESDASALKSRLAAFMRRDAFHTESGGRYTVRSLYFDNASDQALREKLCGVDAFSYVLNAFQTFFRVGAGERDKIRRVE
mgnify:CR=1 FL=1